MESKVVSRTWTRPLVRSLLVWITCMKQAPTYANYSYVLWWRKSVILQDYHSVPTFYSAIVITHSALLIPHSAVLIGHSSLYIVQPYYTGIFFQFHVLLKSPIDNICNNLEISLLCFLVLQYLVNNFLEQWKLIWLTHRSFNIPGLFLCFIFFITILFKKNLWVMFIIFSF